MPFRFSEQQEIVVEQTDDAAADCNETQAHPTVDGRNHEADAGERHRHQNGHEQITENDRIKDGFFLFQAGRRVHRHKGQVGDEAHRRAHACNGKDAQRRRIQQKEDQSDVEQADAEPKQGIHLQTVRDQENIIHPRNRRGIKERKDRQ